MNHHLRNSLSVVAVLASVGAAVAAGPGTNQTNGNLNLTAAQDHEIFQSLSKRHTNEAAPAGFTAPVGSQVPQSMKLHRLPISVTRDVPAVRHYDYVKLPNQVLIVDPKTKNVARIINQG
jgi:Protein of unknown function (DUF1236)